MNTKYILNIQGSILIVLALFLSTSFPWLFYFKENYLLEPLIYSIAIPLLLGLLILYFTRNHTKELRIRDGYFLVSLVWANMGLVGSLFFIFSGSIPSVVNAIFESVSGFTTTGSSILTDIESLPKTVLFWRSLTHWIGGMGIIVLVVAILPALKIAGYQLLSKETSGDFSEKIKPRSTDVAKRLWGIYFLLTLILVILLMLGDLTFYESLCHAFGTIATGGFSTKNASIAYFSNYVQYMIMIFMMLSGINFTLHYFLLKGNFKKVLTDTELKAFFKIIIFTGLIITFILYIRQNHDIEKAFRDSFFQVISILTATGYATADYLKWQDNAWMLIFLLMFIGACVGSTGGGIKVMRHVVAIKSIKKSIFMLLHPRGVKTIRINNQSISDEKAASIITFIVIYLIIVSVGTIFMALIGLDGQTAIGSVLATLGGIGPGIGKVGPTGNFAHIPDIGKIFLSMLMIVGRLEILTFLILFSPGFWKK
ncbi:MAG: TrkH family potassium uptake protein [Bacteroidales bacterium]|nr:TrkH family potassium uptake protein [Bacteroidales bacterium]MCF8344577.1 TrkH family potassium uptake protein [Bacteroidales bacterium]MCF8350682.1 TrkH family potassium uptake protein [Bacteroidales bacterium]MCF8376975.1 TrkH family potassium uptake protein [Bacteroidales bacterium]MCF8400872.1 TrkH family potassium uptake protein [Bacteroidales bacterium]